MPATFFIRVRGQVLGPFTLDALQELKNKGQLADSYEVSQDGQSWQQVAGIKHLLQPGRPAAEPAPTLPAPPVPLAPPLVPPATGAPQPPLAAQTPLPAALPGPATWEALHREPVSPFQPEATEPWFFRYLEIFTRVGMWVGLVLLVLFLLAVLFFSAAAFFSQPKNPGETALFILVGIPSLFLLALFLGLALVFWAALVMLLLDMARRLRSLDRKTPRP